MFLHRQADAASFYPRGKMDCHARGILWRVASAATEFLHNPRHLPFHVIVAVAFVSVVCSKCRCRHSTGDSAGEELRRRQGGRWLHQRREIDSGKPGRGDFLGRTYGKLVENALESSPLNLVVHRTGLSTFKHYTREYFYMVTSIGRNL